jgi:alpha-1,6-mannosyltransferase
VSETNALRDDPRGGRHLRALPTKGLNIVDVAMFYGERSGGIRTYLDEKARFAALSGGFEHHVIVPGEADRHAGGRHELSSVRMGTANGYRIPLGVRGLRETLRAIAPDIVLLHDPFWASRGVIEAVREEGARVVVVHHSSCELNSAGVPGPSGLYVPLFRAWLRRAYRAADAVMSVVDPTTDTKRAATIHLRFGVHEAFRPHPELERGDEVLYVGRLFRPKGVFTLLQAAALSGERWPLMLVGSGPHGDALAARAARLGLQDRVRIMPFVKDRAALAAMYAQASCVVVPGPHETFALVALEAAACGARVVTSGDTPATASIGAAAVTFPSGNPIALLRAIELARRLPRDEDLACELAARFTWERAFRAELRDLERLLGR